MPRREQVGIAVGVLLLVAVPTGVHCWPAPLRGNLVTVLLLGGGLALVWWRSHPRTTSVTALGLFLAAMAVDGGWAFRVVQESLTSALRYAPGSDVRIVVSVEERGRGLAVRVENGRAATADEALAGTGRGPLGLRERIQAVGGQFSAGMTRPGGWAVEAHLPGCE